MNEDERAALIENDAHCLHAPHLTCDMADNELVHPECTIAALEAAGYYVGRLEQRGWYCTKNPSDPLLSDSYALDGNDCDVPLFRKVEP